MSPSQSKTQPGSRKPTYEAATKSRPSPGHSCGIFMLTCIEEARAERQRLMSVSALQLRRRDLQVNGLHVRFVSGGSGAHWELVSDADPFEAAATVLPIFVYTCVCVCVLERGA
jgi:hypothetical protein